MASAAGSSVNVTDVVVRQADGGERRLGDWPGQVLLIVNVASRCNDFGAQEPGTLEEIQQFCSLTYGASFQLFDKVHATGSKTEPYTTLTQAEPAGDVAWNFEKFLVGKDGTVLARFKSGVEPESAELTAAIEAALAA